MGYVSKHEGGKWVTYSGGKQIASASSYQESQRQIERMAGIVAKIDTSKGFMTQVKAEEQGPNITLATGETAEVTPEGKVVRVYTEAPKPTPARIPVSEIHRRTISYNEPSPANISGGTASIRAKMNVVGGYGYQFQTQEAYEKYMKSGPLGVYFGGSPYEPRPVFNQGEVKSIPISISVISRGQTEQERIEQSYEDALSKLKTKIFDPLTQQEKESLSKTYTISESLSEGYVFGYKIPEIPNPFGSKVYEFGLKAVSGTVKQIEYSMRPAALSVTALTLGSFSEATNVFLSQNIRAFSESPGDYVGELATSFLLFKGIGKTGKTVFSVGKGISKEFYIPRSGRTAGLPTVRGGFTRVSDWMGRLEQDVFGFMEREGQISIKSRTISGELVKKPTLLVEPTLSQEATLTHIKYMDKGVEGTGKIRTFTKGDVESQRILDLDIKFVTKPEGEGYRTVLWKEGRELTKMDSIKDVSGLSITYSVEADSGIFISRTTDISSIEKGQITLSGKKIPEIKASEIRSIYQKFDKPQKLLYGKKEITYDALEAFSGKSKRNIFTWEDVIFGGKRASLDMFKGILKEGKGEITFTYGKTKTGEILKTPEATGEVYGKLPFKKDTPQAGSGTLATISKNKLKMAAQSAIESVADIETGKAISEIKIPQPKSQKSIMSFRKRARVKKQEDFLFQYHPAYNADLIEEQGFYTTGVQDMVIGSKSVSGLIMGEKMLRSIKRKPLNIPAFMTRVTQKEEQKTIYDSGQKLGNLLKFGQKFGQKTRTKTKQGLSLRQAIIMDVKTTPSLAIQKFGDFNIPSLKPFFMFPRNERKGTMILGRKKKSYYREVKRDIPLFSLLGIKERKGGLVL